MFSKEMFSQQLRMLRTGLHLRQDDLAVVAGVNKSAICLYETGQRVPSVDVLCALADRLGVSTDVLLGREMLPETGTLFFYEDGKSYEAEIGDDASWALLRYDNNIAKWILTYASVRITTFGGKTNRNAAIMRPKDEIEFEKLIEAQHHLYREGYSQFFSLSPKE